MSTDELRAKIKAFKSHHYGWNPDTDEVLEMIQPGLGSIEYPTPEQTLLIGEGLGMARDEGEWHRNTAPKTIADVITRVCATGSGFTVVDILDILETGIQIGCEEFGT